MKRQHRKLQRTKQNNGFVSMGIRKEEAGVKPSSSYLLPELQTLRYAQGMSIQKWFRKFPVKVLNERPHKKCGHQCANTDGSA